MIQILTFPLLCVLSTSFSIYYALSDFNAWRRRRPINKAKVLRKIKLRGVPSGKDRRNLSMISLSESQYRVDEFELSGNDMGCGQTRKRKYVFNSVRRFFPISLRRRQRTHFQKQSHFFSKLPLEVRLHVYHYFLDTYRVHMVSSYGKISSRPCDITNLENFCDCVSDFVMQTDSTLQGLAPRPVLEPIRRAPQLAVNSVPGILGLLTTCRKM